MFQAIVEGSTLQSHPELFSVFFGGDVAILTVATRIWFKGEGAEKISKILLTW